MVQPGEGKGEIFRQIEGFLLAFRGKALIIRRLHKVYFVLPNIHGVVMRYA